MWSDQSKFQCREFFFLGSFVNPLNCPIFDQKFNLFVRMPAFLEFFNFDLSVVLLFWTQTTTRNVGQGENNFFLLPETGKHLSTSTTRNHPYTFDGNLPYKKRMRMEMSDFVKLKLEKPAFWRPFFHSCSKMAPRFAVFELCLTKLFYARTPLLITVSLLLSPAAVDCCNNSRQ